MRAEALVRSTLFRMNVLACKGYNNARRKCTFVLFTCRSLGLHTRDGRPETMMWQYPGCLRMQDCGSAIHMWRESLLFR